MGISGGELLERSGFDVGCRAIGEEEQEVVSHLWLLKTESAFMEV